MLLMMRVKANKSALVVSESSVKVLRRQCVIKALTSGEKREKNKKHLELFLMLIWSQRIVLRENRKCRVEVYSISKLTKLHESNDKSKFTAVFKICFK